jgi:histidinol-phosphate phosphatase family protein
MGNKLYFSFLATVDDSWTLFLDRDGVINVNKDKSYVFNRDEFVFTDRALEALATVSKMVGKIIVVTNQRGVEKGFMSLADLEDIHAFMKDQIEEAGGRIDSIFYCTSLDDDHPDRKPNVGMPLRAKKMYPEIDFSKSIMVGDKSSDMQLGKNIGAVTVWISSPHFQDTVEPGEIDLTVNSLFEFVQLLQAVS